MGHLDVSAPALGTSARVPAACYAKLKALYGIHSSRGAGSFKEALLVLLLRYQAIGGSGFQLALPTAAFETLVSHFGACAECFASPLNCWFGRFCSAFPDCDAPFGSLGSFQNFRPRRGAFQANPPFSPA